MSSHYNDGMEDGRKPTSTESLRTNSVRETTMNLWAGVVGYRKTDYRGDVQEHTSSHIVPPPMPSRRPIVPRDWSAGTLMPEVQEHNSSVWGKLVSTTERRALFTRLLSSMVWRALLLIFAIILLFGEQVRELWLPKEADSAVNVVFMIVFSFFMIDILLRCDAEENYFVCYRCKKWNMGSFLFWCDLISSLTILYNITFISKRYFSEPYNNIILNADGVPDSGFDRVNQANPVRVDWTLLVIVAETFRVARFIRSSSAVKISSFFNWYLILSFFNPFSWFQRNKNIDSITDSSQQELLRKTASSWSAFGTSAFHESTSKGFFGMFRKNENVAFRRHIAATRIQRAWRNARNAANSTTDFVDVAWRGSHSKSNMERSNNVVRSSQTNATTPVTPPQQQQKQQRRNESQVGSAMRELTGQRVAIGIVLALLFTILFTYKDEDATMQYTMIVLHNQTANPAFAAKSIQAARASSVPDLYNYTMANGTVVEFDVVEDGVGPSGLRDRERWRITVTDLWNQTTIGLFSYRDERREEASVSMITTLFILFVWFFGVVAFAGPVMVLVVTPIERMVRLLGMLMVDPLGYQSTSRYKRFVDEENEITKNTRWTKEILKGMETSFLMSTILRIGSLMKVGFGSAGVEIIRHNLEKGQSKNMLILSSQGSTVSCIFLFCDIRNFTDATECLQEEVFVFTNRIAAVVHSYCHAYGGSANKNVGDAFLVSWQLEEETVSASSASQIEASDSFAWYRQGASSRHEGFVAKNNQADKTLLSVVKTCMALHHEEYYLEPLSEPARQALVDKLKHRKGPVVQMGFGMHAGHAVQGAIGSQRKIDATYVSEAVERAEFLESSTKKYGLKCLMSDTFHRLLHPGVRRRCRKVDQILIRDDDEDEEDDELSGEAMELFTFDMDIDALSQGKSPEGASDTASDSGSKRGNLAKGARNRRMSLRMNLQNLPTSMESDDNFDASGFLGPTQEESARKLVLPTGPALYNANVWMSEDMRTIRSLYSDGLFFQKFMSGLHSFYAKDWDHAKQCFTVILERFEDGPSRYFINQIEEHNGKPPRDFVGYGIA